MSWISPDFENVNGEGLIGFEAEGGGSWQRWHRFLTLDGKRAYEIGNVCGTCEFYFEKLGGANRTFSGRRLSAELEDLRVPPSSALLAALCRILPKGRFTVVVTDARPRLAMPASEFDYFSNEGPNLFGVDTFYGVPHSPKTPYYRLGEERVPPKGMLFKLGIPFQNPNALDLDTIARYRSDLQQGKRPTVFAIAVLDVKGPANWNGNPPYTEHYMLAQYVLDGHHKLRAAAELGARIQFLSFLSAEESVASPDEFGAALRVMGDSGGDRGRRED
jgi:hypothetical protein